MTVPVAGEVHDRGGGNVPVTASALEDALLGRHGRSAVGALPAQLERPLPDVDDYRAEAQKASGRPTCEAL